jgi:hypothetical protein
MKAATIVGIVLIVLGLAGLAYQGFSFTREEEILDVGPIEATKETKETIPIPPIVGVLALAGGVALVVAGTRTGRFAS